ncbi:hypothetical protein J2Z48_001785 [Croceifilum oryzae]|uniref:Uncharacterized protein n=1 Tax=Croceifilum oryzae TaxID=1553429 RepID=A0AAJ1WQJ3_9BACL|nr:hypothetical protein [Croceifilum oryzae]MDQ0417612.1 hypothetical protein [Croceifilum oryzae]
MKYMTDTSGRQVLTFTYTSKNQLQYIDDLVGGRTALTYRKLLRLIKKKTGLFRAHFCECLQLMINKYYFLYYNNFIMYD